MEKWTKGRAGLYIDKSFEPKGIQHPVGGSLFWHLAEVQGLLDLWKSYLELPEQYSIIGCYYDAPMCSWLLIVESEDIPLPKRNEEIPRLYPLYEWNPETGKARVVLPCDVKFRPN